LCIAVFYCFTFCGKKLQARITKIIF